MTPSLSFDEINRQLAARREAGEHSVVGLVFARYDVSLVREVIAESYRYWDRWSGRAFDIFWPGYGEYLPPEDENDDRILLDFAGNRNRVFFDLDAYIGCKRSINAKKWLVNDRFQLLLLNARGGKLSYSKHIKIDFEQDCGPNRTEIRDVMEFLIAVCQEEHDLDGVRFRLLKRKAGKVLREKFTVGEIFKLMEKLAK